MMVVGERVNFDDVQHVFGRVHLRNALELQAMDIQADCLRDSLSQHGLLNVWLEVSTETLIRRCRERARESEGELDPQLFEDLKRAYGECHQDKVRRGNTVFSLDGEQSATRVASQLRMLASWVNTDTYCMIPLSVGRDPYGRTLIAGFAPPSGLVSVTQSVEDDDAAREGGRVRRASAVMARTEAGARPLIAPAIGVPFPAPSLPVNLHRLPRIPPLPPDMPDIPDAPPSPPGATEDEDDVTLGDASLVPELDLPPSVRSLEMALQLSDAVPPGTLDALLSASCADAAPLQLMATQEEADAFRRWLASQAEAPEESALDVEGAGPPKRQRVTSPIPAQQHPQPMMRPAGKNSTDSPTDLTTQCEECDGVQQVTHESARRVYGAARARTLMGVVGSGSSSPRLFARSIIEQALLEADATHAVQEGPSTDVDYGFRGWNTACEHSSTSKLTTNNFSSSSSARTPGTHEGDVGKI